MEVHQGSLAPQGLSPIPLSYQQEYSKHWLLTVLLGQQVGIILEGMTDKARRLVGLITAPLLIVLGLWLVIEGVWHGPLSEIFWIGPFLIWIGPFLVLAGGLWLASDWFDL
jgi:hypothetical protein